MWRTINLATNTEPVGALLITRNLLGDSGKPDPVAIEKCWEALQAFGNERIAEADLYRAIASIAKQMREL